MDISVLWLWLVPSDLIQSFSDCLCFFQFLLLLGFVFVAVSNVKSLWKTLRHVCYRCNISFVALGTMVVGSGCWCFNRLGDRLFLSIEENNNVKNWRDSRSNQWIFCWMKKNIVFHVVVLTIYYSKGCSCAVVERRLIVFSDDSLLWLLCIGKEMAE